MEKNGTFVHWCWKYKLVQPLWKRVWRFLFKKKKKKKIGLLLFDPAVSLLGIFPKKTNTNLKQYMGMTQRDGMGRVVGGGKKKKARKKKTQYTHPCVHCSIIYCSQDMEAFIDRWMDKEDVINICHSSVRKMKYCHLWQHGWTSRVLLSEINHIKTNTVWFHLYVEYKKWNK